MRLSQNDLKSLQVFRAVVEYGGFTGAQAALDIGQPAVSFHIKALEDRVGFRLCNRGRGGFSLTERGQIVYERSKGLFSSLSDFESVLGELRHTITGTLRLGVVDNTITNKEMPIHDLVHEFLRQAPRAQIEITVSLPEQLMAEIGNGGLDIAIVPEVRQAKGLNSTRFYDEAHSLFAAEGHPILKADPLSRAVVEEQAFAVRSYGNSRELVHFPKAQVHAKASTMEALAMFVLSGHFIGYLPDHYAGLWVRQGRLRALLPEETAIVSPFFIVTQMRERRSLLLRTFLRILVSASWARTHEAGSSTERHQRPRRQTADDGGTVQDEEAGGN